MEDLNNVVLDELKQLDPLTTLVIEYQQNPTPQILKKIYNSTKRLVYAVFRYYDIIRTFPLDVQDDIEEDCRSFVLLKCIDRFDNNKNAKFGTFYTWWLKSHIRSRKHFYIRRMHLIDTLDINGNVVNKNSMDKLEDILSTFDTRVISTYKQKYQQIFV